MNDNEQTEQTPAPAMETERAQDARKLANFLNSTGWDTQYISYLFEIAGNNNLFTCKKLMI